MDRPCLIRPNCRGQKNSPERKSRRVTPMLPVGLRRAPVDDPCPLVDGQRTPDETAMHRGLTAAMKAWSNGRAEAAG